MRVKRVLNSNAVVVDDGGRTSVALGKGIGYGVRPGDRIDPARVSETYVPDRSRPLEQLAAFLTEVPLPVIRVAHDVAAVAHERLGVPVSQSLVLPIADHLAFALRRQEEGIELESPLRWEVRQLYPDEVAVGAHCLDLVRQRLGVQLPADEAVSLALHLVNAGFAGEGLARTVGMTERLTQILSIVEGHLGLELDRDSMAVARFVTHLRYLFVRIAQGRERRDASSRLTASVREAHPEAYACAQRIALVLELGDSGLNEDEVVYLTLHVARLAHDHEAG